MPKSTISQEIRRLRKRDAKTGVGTPRTTKKSRSATPRRTRAPVPVTEPLSSAAALAKVELWFHERGWKPFAFQIEVWTAQLNRESGLIQVPTGSGKTYAAFMGALARVLSTPYAPGVRILYVTPLKAVSRDITLAIEKALRDIAPHMSVEDRTGDTTPSARARQKLAMPEVLVTTPESLAILISHEDHQKTFRHLDSIILDEWHECLSTKRGSLLELTLARLRSLRPNLSTWALSATIANRDEAARVAAGENARIVSAKLERPLHIESLLPERIDSFPWAGQLGLRMLGPLIEHLDPARSTLIFTNTRSQAERWFQAILTTKPEWTAKLALHHGSLDRDERAKVESGLKDGSISLVVCTSSLDLGVDFGPVERVVQIGSPKGIARLVQRAGRSSHRPGEAAKLLFVPTHSLELLEIAAARRALDEGWIEARTPIYKPLDVLVQHLVTRAVGGGFTRSEMENELSLTYSFRDLTSDELDWALNFVCEGGASLQGYPSFRRVVKDDGLYKVRDGQIARLHRMNIGTIDSDATVRLKFQRGREIGSVEEGFIAKLKPGDRFLFSGRVLKFMHLKDLDAVVKLATGSATVSPSWAGSRLPYTRPLSRAVRETLLRVREGFIDDKELAALAPVFDAQRRLSSLPGPNELLIETLRTREGWHLFLYPFEGRVLHESLGALLAYRLAKWKRATFSITCNDYGLELLAAGEFDFREAFLTHDFFTPTAWSEDLRDAVNLTQLARQKFREVARVAGLLHPGHPGARKNARQLQVSAGLLFDVISKYEPDHLLIAQAKHQALGEALESARLDEVLARLSKMQIKTFETPRPTPLGFPLLADRMGAKLSTESLEERITRLKEQWTKT